MMASAEAIRNYHFTEFNSPLERTNATHSHRITREVETVLYDSFALDEVLRLDPLAVEQRLEGWARSYYTKEKHMQSILNYGTNDPPARLFDINSWQHAIEATRTELTKLGRVRAFNALTELDQVPYESTAAAGFDYPGNKGRFRGPNHMRAISRARAILGSAVDNTDGIHRAILTMVPDVGYTRTQLTYLPDKLKVRGVWGRAFHYILLEGTVAAPLLEAFKHTDTFFYIGKDPVFDVPRTIHRAKHEGEWLFTLDWSGFDATASTYEINTAFDLIKEIIEFPNWQTEVAFELSRHLFIHKKIAAPDGNIYFAHKGVPSGSYFTMIIGSIINKLRCEYMWHLIHGKSPAFIVTQGDDALGSDNEQFNVEVAAEAVAPLNWFLNPNKVEITKFPYLVEFLGRTEKGGINVRELTRCLRLLVYPETEVVSGEISAYRARAIAEDAGGLSELLNRVAQRLADSYGIAEEQNVPKRLRLYSA